MLKLSCLGYVCAPRHLGMHVIGVMVYLFSESRTKVSEGLRHLPPVFIIQVDHMSFFTSFDSFKTTRIHATSAQVFNVLKRVEHWPVWDVDLKKVTLDTPASTPLNSTKGTLFMKNYGGGEHAFAIQNVDEARHFEYYTRLPGVDSEWYWTWSEHPTDGYVDMKMGVRVHGGAALLWRGALAPFLGSAFDSCLRNFKSLAEHGQVDGQDFTHLYQ